MTGKQRFKSINVYPTTDFTLPTFDNTKLSAINTCPTWGLVRYAKHKAMTPSGHAGRSMALEAGAAAHEVFAAHRFWFWYNQPTNDIVTTEFLRKEGQRIFGEDRYRQMIDRLVQVPEGEDDRVKMLAFTLAALETSGFYDDPNDRYRTTTNIEEMCIAYMDRYDWSTQLPALITVNNTLRLGIEIPIDVTIEYTLISGEVERYRFTGKADGVHYWGQDSDRIRIHENKTSSRLGSAWEDSFSMAHQPTGYMIALSTILGDDVTDAVILGSQLPLPKSVTLGGLSRVTIHREPFMFSDWFDWFYHTVEIHNRYIGDVADAPHYTHSCNRYFRPCSLIPFCASPYDDRVQMLEEMTDDEWTPLDTPDNDA